MITVRLADDFVARIHEDYSWTAEEGSNDEALDFLNREFNEHYVSDSIDYFTNNVHRVADAAARELKGLILEIDEEDIDEGEEPEPEDRIY